MWYHISKRQNSNSMDLCACVCVCYFKSLIYTSCCHIYLFIYFGHVCSVLSGKPWRRQIQRYRPRCHFDPFWNWKRGVANTNNRHGYGKLMSPWRTTIASKMIFFFLNIRIMNKKKTKKKTLNHNKKEGTSGHLLINVETKPEPCLMICICHLRWTEESLYSHAGKC